MAKTARKTTATPKAQTETAPAANRDRLDHAGHDAIAGVADRSARRALVWKAVSQVRPGVKRGKRSEMWRLPYQLLIEAAEAYLLDFLTAQEVIAAFRAQIDQANKGLKPDDRVRDIVIERWLMTVRNEYNAVHAASLDERSEALDFAACGDNLLSVMARLFSLSAPCIAAAFRSNEWGEMGADIRHTLVRYHEVLAEAAKVQDEARKRQMETKKLALAMTERVRAGAAAGQIKGDVDAVVGIIAATMGVPELSPAAAASDAAQAEGVAA